MSAHEHTNTRTHTHTGKMPVKLGYPGKLKQKINNSCNNIENNKTKSDEYIDENNFEVNYEIKNENLLRNEDRSKDTNKETITDHHRPIRSADSHVEREKQSVLNANKKLIGIGIENTSCLPDKKTTTIKSSEKKTSVDEFQKKIAVTKKKMTKKNSDGNASQWSTKRPLPLPPAYELLSDVSTTKIALAVIEVVEEEDVGESANKNISDNHLTIRKELRRLVS